jgi:hypothetical protein
MKISLNPIPFLLILQILEGMKIWVLEEKMDK